MDIGSNTVSCLNRRKNTKNIKKSKNTVDNHRNLWYKYSCDAEVAELADAQASGACGSNTVRVQVPPSALFIFCLKNSQSRLRVLFFYTLHDARVLCASGTCLAPTEAERRKDCGSATHGTFMSQTSARYK